MASSKVLSAGQRVGLFQIEQLLGRSARTEVYLATVGDGTQQVALKILDSRHVADPPNESTFLAAAEKLASLQGENLPLFMHAGVEDGRFYVATEYVPGRSAREVLLDEKRSYARELAFFQGAAQTLLYAKRYGLSHGNFGPDDILVPDAERDPVILNVGSVDLFGFDRESAQRSPIYRAPEQLTDGVVNEQTDSYSLAMVLYEFIARRPPFTREDGTIPDHAELNALLRTDYPRPLPELRKDAERAWQFIRKGISKDPRDRHADLKEFNRESIQLAGWYLENPAPSSPLVAFLNEFMDRAVEIAQRKEALSTQPRRASLSRVHSHPPRRRRQVNRRGAPHVADPVPPQRLHSMPHVAARPESAPAAAPPSPPSPGSSATAPPAPTPMSSAPPTPSPRAPRPKPPAPALATPSPSRRADAPPVRVPEPPQEQATDPVTLPSGHLGVPAHARDTARGNGPALLLIPAVMLLMSGALLAFFFSPTPEPLVLARPAVLILPSFPSAQPVLHPSPTAEATASSAPQPPKHPPRPEAPRTPRNIARPALPALPAPSPAPAPDRKAGPANAEDEPCKKYMKVQCR